MAMSKEMHAISVSKSTLSNDLCPVVREILIYPEMIAKEKKTRAKVFIPRHVTSEAALKVLEAQDTEKRRKELVKEARRQKRGWKVKEKDQENNQNIGNENEKGKKIIKKQRIPKNEKRSNEENTEGSSNAP